MTRVILEFPKVEVEFNSASHDLSARLGNGVRLIARVPEWITEIQQAKLQLVLEVNGSPDASPSENR